MRRYVTTLLLILSACMQSHAEEVAVPRELEDWRGWALQGQEFRRCPFLPSQGSSNEASYRCAWPERVTLALDARGGTFAQRWQVFAETWVRIPGSVEHWPQDVRVNGAPAAVVLREGYPHLLLAAGAHAVAGRLAWPARPESLAIDPRTAMVDLTIDSRRIVQPERPGGAVWLGKRRASEQPARLEVQVYRLLQDDIPARLLTRMRLQVSGDGREELLARVLPEGFTPLWLESALPSRLEPDGRLRVQVRAGSWDINLEARAAGVAAQLTRPPVADGLWAREEVWSFAGDDRLRVADAQGAEGIDPVQANVPAEWRGYPAFRMTQDATLDISERSRGLQNTDDNRLSLFRQLWLDFDHRGLTAVDRLTGTLRKDWRLEMTGPYALQSARTGDQPLLITRNPQGEGAGLEVRTPQLELEAVARAAGSRGSMPATGWSERFERVAGQLNLPPGHRLIAALGADRAPGAWVERWGLWGLFGVLVVAVFSGWLAGWIAGAIAFCGLLLTYQESPAYIWLWANALAALALARAAPEGRLRRFAGRYRAVSFTVLGIALLPLLWGQARLALHPQLDTRIPQMMAADVQLDAAPGFATGQPVAPPPPPAPPAEAPVDATQELSANDAPEEMARQKRALSRSDSKYSSPVAAAITAAAGGLNVAQVVQRYAPGTLIQTGPGIPAWRYLVYPYEWSGPVDPEQTVRFVYIGPLLLGLWRFAGIALLAALFVALLLSSGSGPRQRSDLVAALRRVLPRRGGEPQSGSAREPGDLRGTTTGAALLGAPLLALSLALAAASPAQAAPDTGVLNELRTRLTAPPTCTPTCAEVTEAHLSVRAERLEVTLQVSALASVAVPVPSAGDRWQLDSVTVDGRSALTIGREADGTFAVPLPVGAHTVRLAGVLPAAESVQLEFPSAPRVVSVSSDGWDVAGVNEGRLLAGSVELIRRRSAAPGAAALETSSEFPAFVRVLRTFDLGLDWSVNTTVVRLAPEKAAVAVEVPLLAGESALSEGLRTRDLPDGRRLALVGLERGQRTVEWASGLARSETLDLELPQDAARAEVWHFVVSPQWNVRFEGLPAVLPQHVNPAMWVYEFYPRPGEKLRLHITRPDRAEGSTLALDSVRQTLAVGKRSTSTTLEFDYRSTQGGRHAIALPKSARVTSVHLDGQPAQLRPDDGVLSIGLLPGMHSVRVDWEMATGASFRTQAAPVDLRASASNVQTQISLPASRWPLFVSGSGVGPAVLYWSELIVFVVTALLLGRWKRSPLKTHEWLLLGWGLSTLSWVVLVLVAVWLFAMEWRERWPGAARRWQFNGVQLVLAGLTVLAVGTLVFLGIRQSLLASPDMGVTGPGSFGNRFAWFLDRAGSGLPQPTVFSVPMWVYRALMFAWALWLVLALLRWLRWAWQSWKTGGLWRGRDAVAAAR